MKTQTQYMIDGMLKVGMTELQNPKTSKYRVFKSPKNPDMLYYVGKAGALRVGKNVSSSTPVWDKDKRALIRLGKGETA